MAQRRTSERAKRALAVRSQSPWFDPATLGIALQLGRSIGLRRIAPLAAAGVLAAGWRRNGSATGRTTTPQSSQGRGS